MRTREEDLQRAGAGALSESKEEQRSGAVAGVGVGWSHQFPSRAVSEEGRGYGTWSTAWPSLSRKFSS